LTWQRLFLSRQEANALGVLLVAEYGWNLSVINRAEAPRASPDPGYDGRPTYRIPVEKRRRGGGRWYDTENVTDSGADSRGRLITQALQATRFARAIVAEHSPQTDRLIIWHAANRRRQTLNKEMHPPVLEFFFHLSSNSGREWANGEGFTGSPFRRGRRTVNAVEHREPAGHGQSTHDRQYALPDQQVQAAAVPVIADGAEAAVARAREMVLVAEMRQTRDPADVETATVDCKDFDHGPVQAPGGGCGASFLMCLACENARVHADHHPRLALLHASLASAHSVLPPGRWAEWDEAHARLENLKSRVGPGGWAHALARITDDDRELVRDLLTGALDI
jgi:hypothetical protein